MKKKSKDTLLTPKVSRAIMFEKGGVKNMIKEAERFTLRLTGELKERLDESRKRLVFSLIAVVVQILWDWVERHGSLSINRHSDEGREGVGIYQHEG